MAGLSCQIDDNFRYMDESERTIGGEFETLETAIAACRKIVDDDLASPGAIAGGCFDSA